MKQAIRHLGITLLMVLCAGIATSYSQTPNDPNRQNVRTVSIPISIFTKEELKEDRLQEYVQVERLIVKEDREDQTILSIRSVSDAPLALAVVIQDDLVSDFNLQLKDTAKFIRSLPRGSRVMVAYARGGAPEIRQRFTDDLNKAADSLRIVVSSNSASARSPYDAVVDILDRFDALPAGRRAILLVSDGLDLSAGTAGASPSQSIELDKAILRAQRKSVAVFPIYSPSVNTENSRSTLNLIGQGSLQKLADETGGRAFFQGTGAAISFDPFFRDLSILLNRQFLLTYLSTHLKKGYHRIDVTSTNPQVKVEHPKGYYYR